MTTIEENSAILVDSNGGQLALKEVKVRARLHELVAEVEVEQSYVNPQNINIETAPCANMTCCTYTLRNQ